MENQSIQHSKINNAFKKLLHENHWSVSILDTQYTEISIWGENGIHDSYIFFYLPNNASLVIDQIDTIIFGSAVKDDTTNKTYWLGTTQVQYDDDSWFDYWISKIPELQPKAEKLTRKELVILDRVFEGHYLEYGRAEDGLIYAIGICSEKLVDEIFEHYSVVEDPNVYLQYIAADKEDLKVLTHINKALNNVKQKK